MNGYSLLTRACTLSAAFFILVGCGNNNVDDFGGILDASTFDAFHIPDAEADLDGDGVDETIFPDQGYFNGAVVQFYNMGPMPVVFSEAVNGFVTTPGLIFKFQGECDDSAAPPQLFTDDANGFNFDPINQVISPFRQHDLIDAIPDGSGAYNPIVEVVNVAINNKVRCNELLSVDTLRLRFASEDANGNGVLDVNEDTDFDGQIDNDLGGDLVPVFTGEFKIIEAFGVSTRLPDMVASTSFDPTGVNGFNLSFGRFDPDGFSEDIDIDLTLDLVTEFDVDEDGVLDQEDLDLDGNLDVNEDVNGNNVLDPGEDIDGDGRLDRVDEDVDGNEVLTIEDIDFDGNRDCGEVLDPAGCIASLVNRAPITEDINGNGVLDPGEDGSEEATFGVPNGILDTEDIDGDGTLDITEDLNGNGAIDGVFGGIPVYRDEFNVFFKTRLLHLVEFRAPTVRVEPQEGLDLFVVETMDVFVDAEDDQFARVVFSALPGDPNFQPVGRITRFTRAEGVLPGQIKSLADVNDPLLVAEAAETNEIIHVAFPNDDPIFPGDGFRFSDADGDGLPDFIENQLGFLPGVIDGEYLSNPAVADTDGDGILDGDEDLNANGIIEDGETDPTVAD